MKLKAFAFTILMFASPLFAGSNQLITNFSKVNEGVYRGARITSFKAVKYLKFLGIKNVINLQGGDLDSNIGIIIPWAEPAETDKNIALEKSMVFSKGLGFYHAPLNSLEPITNSLIVLSLVISPFSAKIRINLLSGRIGIKMLFFTCGLLINSSMVLRK